MSSVFVLDTEKRPLTPVHPGEARRLLTAGKAAVWRRYPFSIILKRTVSHAPVEPLRLKVDPGSKTTGVAIVNDARGQVVAALEITHRGQQIRNSLLARRAVRHNRRSRHTRYRPARHDNRRRPAGWLPPSLESRVQNILTWVARLRRHCPIAALSLELVKFDTVLLQHPEISGVEYQHGELAGYEVREYLVEMWGRQCAYCGATNVPLQVEHIVPRARGGSDRASNLTISCEPCNKKKGARTAAEFGYPHIQARARQPLRDAAAVNATRLALYARLQATGLPVEMGTWGPDQVEPDTTESAQNPLAGCSVCWGKHSCVTDHGGNNTPLHHGNWTRISSNVSHGHLWLSAHISQAPPHRQGVPNRRHRASHSSQW